jgi:hypothetical protein
MRTLAIWIFGLLASMIIGGMIGAQLDVLALRNEYSFNDHNNAVFGILAGAFIFACLRLWLAAPTKKPPSI